MIAIRNKFLPLLFATLSIWTIFSYILIFHPTVQPGKEELIYTKIHSIQRDVNELSKDNERLLKKLRLKENHLSNSFNSSFKINLFNNLKHQTFIMKSSIVNSRNQNHDMLTKIKPLLNTKRIRSGLTTIAILVISCNRITVKRCIDQLLKFKPNERQFPIIVSQDCNHHQTMDVIKNFRGITYIQQPDQSEIKVPSKEKKFSGYFKISRHYAFALNEAFVNFGYDTTIVVEDDLDISLDFFEYFLGTYPILKADPTLWCVSAWNDNGKPNLIDINGSELLYRTDFFPGLGWMLTRKLWLELSPKWPKSYWDDWIRHPEQRKNRACIRPELSRTRTFGKFGVSNGMFFDKHLQFIRLNEQPVFFTQKNLTYLVKANYDLKFFNKVYQSEEITCNDLKNNKQKTLKTVRIPYFSRRSFKNITKIFGLMEDFKSGVPRTGYCGIVTFYYKKQRVYLAPNSSWSGYDVLWN